MKIKQVSRFIDKRGHWKKIMTTTTRILMMKMMTWGAMVHKLKRDPSGEI